MTGLKLVQAHEQAVAWMKKKAETWLDGQWRALRDGVKGQYVDRIHGALALLRDVGVLTQVEAEGWAARLKRCPGHDDEGGRAWCGYCGNMTAESSSAGVVDGDKAEMEARKTWRCDECGSTSFGTHMGHIPL